MEKGYCLGCEKQWLGSYWGVWFCNECAFSNEIPVHDCRTEQGQGCELCIKWFAAKEKKAPREELKTNISFSDFNG